MKWPQLTGSDLTPHQLEQVGIATSRRLGILGGGPGCGKTFTAARLINATGRQIGFHRIAVAGPTGKSAVRITELMQGYGVPLRATTIHSLLGVAQASEYDGWSFQHNRANPLDCSVIIVDEASMLDVDLARSLFAARPRDALMLLIGDVNQLPPVGHGAPLRDMIASGCVPYGELKEIMRNDGGIVQACADIRDGRAFQPEGNLRHVSARGAEAVRDALVETIDEASRRHGVDPTWDVQVLVAVNKKGLLCRKELNKLLQNLLNPNPEIPGSVFRLGDKVVNTKNGWFKLSEHHRVKSDDTLTMDDDNRVYVANGELGEVVACGPKTMEVRLTAPDRIVFVPRGQEQQKDGGDDDDDSTPGTGCNWDLGYALSTHKSQGSEWPVAIVVIDDSSSAAQVCSREWIYTAISRAKQSCYLVGPLHTAQGFARRTSIDKRKTFLAQRIRQAVEAF